MLQVRNVPDELHSELRRRASAAGMSLSDYVLRELRRVGERSPAAEVLARAASVRIPLTMDEVTTAVREDRDDR